MNTCIPNTDGLKALRSFLSHRPNQSSSTNTLIRSTELVLTLNNFSFNSSHFLQTNGVAVGIRMGLKFTWTISNTSLPFLDLSISISGKCLNTDIYFKPTDSHSYLDYTSSHPPSCKNVIPYSQLLHLCHICSQDGAFHSCISQISSYFKDRNGFTCTSSNLVDYIRCSRCGLLYIGEAKLGDQFAEQLHSVCYNQQHLLVMNHFNSPSHSLGDMSILGLL
eukprot:g24715.t1